MKYLKIFFIVILLLPFCNCYPPSFCPIWDEQHSVFEKNLLGEWKGIDSDNFITKNTDFDHKSYFITITEGQNKSSYYARLIRLRNHYYIELKDQLSSNERQRLEGEIYQPLIPMYWFAQLQLDGDTLKVSIINAIKFNEKISKKEINLSFIERQDVPILLISNTTKIQQALEQIDNDKDLWKEIWVLKRNSAH
jgi:hypothetical protein